MPRSSVPHTSNCDSDVLKNNNVVPVGSSDEYISANISNDVSSSPVNPHYCINKFNDVSSNEHLPKVLSLTNRFISQILEVSLDDHVPTIQVLLLLMLIQCLLEKRYITLNLKIFYRGGKIDSTY